MGGTADPSSLVERARAFARRAHEEAGDSDFDHPTAVARLLAARGADDELLAAALLHEVVEDTGHGLAEITERFGAAVGDLVGPLTEDASIGSYAERKSAHRRAVAAAGPRVAAIFAADKVARVRALAQARESVSAERLEHYERSLAMLRSDHPGVDLIDELARALEDLRRHGA